MVRSRRESHHSDGITDQKSLQQTSATKSAQSGHPTVARQCLLSRVKPISGFQSVMSAFDPEQTFSASFDHFVDDQLLAPDQ
jgi:hypothetical protein